MGENRKADEIDKTTWSRKKHKKIKRHEENFVSNFAENFAVHSLNVVQEPPAEGYHLGVKKHKRKKKRHQEYERNSCVENTLNSGTFDESVVMDENRKADEIEKTTWSRKKYKKMKRHEENLANNFAENFAEVHSSNVVQEPLAEGYYLGMKKHKRKKKRHQEYERNSCAESTLNSGTFDESVIILENRKADRIEKTTWSRKRHQKIKRHEENFGSNFAENFAEVVDSSNVVQEPLAEGYYLGIKKHKRKKRRHQEHERNSHAENTLNSDTVDESVNENPKHLETTHQSKNKTHGKKRRPSEERDNSENLVSVGNPSKDENVTVTVVVEENFKSPRKKHKRKEKHLENLDSKDFLVCEGKTKNPKCDDKQMKFNSGSRKHRKKHKRKQREEYLQNHEAGFSVMGKENCSRCNTDSSLLGKRIKSETEPFEATETLSFSEECPPSDETTNHYQVEEAESSERVDNPGTVGSTGTEGGTGILVERRDLFVPPHLDLIIHPRNSVDGRGSREKQLREELEARGIYIRTGKWTPEETDMLRANWEQLLKDNPIENPFNLLTRKSVESSSQVKQLKRYVRDTDFYTSLARGLNRSTYSCFVKARKMFHTMNKGSFTDNEFRRLKALKQRYGNKWTEIGKMMDRTGSSLFDMYRWRSDKTKAGEWTVEEEEQLVNAVQQAMGTEDASNLYHRIPWAQVAKFVPSRSSVQCRLHWIQKVAWTVNNEGKREKWNKNDTKELIESIYEMPVFEESEIDWDALLVHFTKAASPQYLSKRWFDIKTTVPSYHRKSFDEIRECLYNKFHSKK